MEEIPVKQRLVLSSSPRVYNVPLGLKSQIQKSQNKEECVYG